MLLHPFRRPGLWVWPEFRLDNDSYLPTVFAKGTKSDLTVAAPKACHKAVEAIEYD